MDNPIPSYDGTNLANLAAELEVRLTGRSPTRGLRPELAELIPHAELPPADHRRPRRSATHPPRRSSPAPPSSSCPERAVPHHHHSRAVLGGHGPGTHAARSDRLHPVDTHAPHGCEHADVGGHGSGTAHRLRPGRFPPQPQPVRTGRCRRCENGDLPTRRAPGHSSEQHGMPRGGTLRILIPIRHPAVGPFRCRQPHLGCCVHDSRRHCCSRLRATIAGVQHGAFPNRSSMGTLQTLPATRHHPRRISRPRPLRHPPDGKIYLDENLTDGTQCWGDGRVLMFSGPLERVYRIARRTGAQFVSAEELHQRLGGGPPHPALNEFPTAALLMGVHHFCWFVWEGVVVELPAGEYCTLLER